ncbi:MAG: glycosyltransferase, partial [Acidobacteriota bacterium]
MSAKPLAVYVSPNLAPWLSAFPAEVAVLTPPPGIFDLPAALEEHGLRPDVIIQDERLAPRVLLKGLETLACPKVFWSLDPHLNPYWQAPYAALFDAVAVTQKNWVEPMRRAGNPDKTMSRQVEWITWNARSVAWTPFAARPDNAVFVGRINEFRPVRELFAQFLAARFPLRLETDIEPGMVQDAYAQARLAPNESIRGEINQRLFAAAGAGALVLEPALDNGLEELFEPDREVALYADALELDEAMRRFSAHPQEAERMGRAAWERVRREHRPEHRVQAMGRLALSAQAGAGASGEEGERQFWLAAGRALESNLLAAPPEEVIQGLARFQEDPACLVCILSLLAAGGQARDALHLALKFAADGFAPADASFQACLCALALRLEEFPLAKRLHQDFTRAAAEPHRPVESPAGLYAALAESVARRDLNQRPGFPFDPVVHLPAAGSEFFHMSLTLAPDDVEVLRKAEALLRSMPGNELYRMGYLSEISLRNREDFRLGLSLGLMDLKLFRIEQGLEELRVAREQAREQGKLPSFERALAAQDPHGRIRAALGG